MPEYCINLNAQQNQSGEHEVHNIGAGLKEGCLPNAGNQISLGKHENCERAVAYAKTKYPQWLIDGCKHCIPRCHKM